MRLRKLLFIAFSKTINPSARRTAIAANAASISSNPRTSNDCSLIPNVCAAAIDVLDAHDGHVLTKGHAGAAVLPALLAFTDGQGCSGREFLACLVLGYEIATPADVRQLLGLKGVSAVAF